MIIETLKRFGITTGAAAAAASKAAALAALGATEVLSVTIPTPIGLRIEIPIEEIFRKEDMYCAKVKKFSGDNPDVLDGIEIISCVSIIENQEIVIEGGKGIGVVTRQGMKVPVGKRAINPVPYKMIEEAVKEVLKGKGAKVIIEVPEGENLASKTMNPDVGIVGGISILGTTGLEMPVSDEDYIEHIKCELNVIRTSSETVVISPGNTGASYSRVLYGNIVIKVGDRIGDTISQAIKMGFKRIILAGLPGKLIKVAVGILNTHSKYGDARIEALTHACIVSGVPLEVIEKVARSLTVEEALSYLGEYKSIVMKYIADKILKRLEKIGNVEFGVVIFDYNGNILARSGKA